MWGDLQILRNRLLVSGSDSQLLTPDYGLSIEKQAIKRVFRRFKAGN
jgi:hypothetical protein